MTYPCRSCGYPLSDPPYNDGEPSYDICSCCSYQFGKTDRQDEITYEEWRQKWIDEGMKFWSKRKEPVGWDPKRQLLNIGVKL